MDKADKDKISEVFKEGGSEQQDSSAKEEGKDFTIALSYIGILFLVPLFVYKNNDFAKFHIKQGLVLFVAELLTMVVGWIPILGWFVAFIAWIVWIVLAITGVMNVLSTKKSPLPIIGKFSENFKF
jgi:uncharacterized membrane protein